MKLIIVPTNFSASSLNAARYAGDMAVAARADLHLLHIMEPSLSNASIPLTENICDEMQQNNEEGLKSLKAELEKQTNGKVKIFTRLEYGSVEHQLEESCKRQKPLAVVMGIKKSSAGRFVFGSNVLFAIQYLPFPLLVIPENAHFRAIGKILLACDLTDKTESIPIEYLTELKNTFHAVLQVLSVNTREIDQLQPGNEFVALSKLLHDLYPTYYTKIANTVEEGVNSFLKENNVDLLLLLPKKHGFFEFHKSHTKKMLLRAGIPVMAIHQKICG